MECNVIPELYDAEGGRKSESPDAASNEPGWDTVLSNSGKKLTLGHTSSDRPRFMGTLEIRAYEELGDNLGERG
jgi:hypothetical protein